MDWAGAARADAAWQSLLWAIISRWPHYIIYFFTLLYAAQNMADLRAAGVAPTLLGMLAIVTAIALTAYFVIRRLNPIAPLLLIYVMAFADASRIGNSTALSGSGWTFVDLVFVSVLLLGFTNWLFRNPVNRYWERMRERWADRA